MRLAVLADVHGNLDALNAVLDDLALQSPDLTVNLGDCLSGPLWPGETADLLMQLGWPAVRGNHDRWLVERPSPLGPWEADSLPHLKPAQLDWLATLPATRRIDDIFLCHATPQDDTTYWLHDVRSDGLFAPSAPARVARIAGEVEAGLLLCGHTHLAAAVRLPDGRIVVNPGSVGCPGFEDDHPVYHRAEAGTPHACYAILDAVRGGWSVAFRRVAYEPRRAADLAAARGRPDWAGVLATGWLPNP